MSAINGEIFHSTPLTFGVIDFTNLTLASTAEMLSRARMVPCRLEADLTRWGREQTDAFERLLNGYISQTRNLRISGKLPIFTQLVSPAPILKSLFLLHSKRGISNYGVIPIKLFDHNAPSLTSLELENCGISLESPLFKGLQTLKIINPPKEMIPTLEDWLDALDKMTQLETFILKSFTPLGFESDSWRIITHPSLTKFHISASAKDCAVALAHLMMPALTSLHVNAKSQDQEGEDVRPLIPYVSQNVSVLQGTKPLRSILIDSKKEPEHAEVLAWTMSGADFNFRDPDVIMDRASVPACLIFSVTGSIWRSGVNNAILEAFLTLIPVNSISTLTTRNKARFSKKFWDTPRWSLLKRASLTTSTFSTLLRTLTKDAPHDGPRLPWLTKLILVGISMNASNTHSLWTMLIQRVEQGVPVEKLDLSMSVVGDGDIQLLREVVVDVKEPLTKQALKIQHATYKYESDSDNFDTSNSNQSRRLGAARLRG